MTRDDLRTAAEDSANPHGDSSGVTFDRRTAIKTAVAGLGAVTLPWGTAAASSRTDTQSDDLHSLMITANGPLEYEFTVDGTLEADTEHGDFSADSDDEPKYVENSPSVYTVIDETGPTLENAGGTAFHGDRFLVDYYAHLTLDAHPDYEANVYLDETLVTVDELNRMQLTDPSLHTLTIAANGPTSYELQVEPEMTPDHKGGNFSADEDDAPTENADGTFTAAGTTGPLSKEAGAKTVLGDRYLFSGSVETLDLQLSDSSHEKYVYLDEKPVNPSVVRQMRF
ncbi:hypothetical protein [Halopelagius fulvigenes]|uniref:DUF4397 domain-containing protein n=1 Tax=Halopelagius fulvigenes TaxID=1198324 RepID=A0ABD5TSX2_9EURY